MAPFREDVYPPSAKPGSRLRRANLVIGSRAMSGQESAPAASERAGEEDAPKEKKAPARKSVLARWLEPGSRSRRILIGLGIYCVCIAVFAAVAGPIRLGQRTDANHYALLADAWLHGRQDLPNGWPQYTHGNDFAQVDEGAVKRTYISFPPFPAVLMLPFVKLAGSPDEFRDGQLVVWLAGIGPALLFLVLEKLRRKERSARTETENVALSLLFAFGTVYFFTAVEGTVWFAAHVVGVALGAGFLLVAIDPDGVRDAAIAGLVLACAWLTRPFMIFMALLFALEAIRVCCKDGLPTEGSVRARLRETWKRLDKAALAKRYVAFAVPILGAFAVMSWMNASRFHDANPFMNPHEYLTVAWKARMHTWGSFSYHYLAKNLGVALTVLPWTPAKGTFCFDYTQPSFFRALFEGHHCTPLKVNEHGLALWFTVPIYFWLFRAKKRGWLFVALAVAAGIVAGFDLLYQNTGWRQFGYRFSNDYAPLLFVMLAIGVGSMRRRFAVAALWGVAWNLFGAITFDRANPSTDRFYFSDGSQTVVYQPD
jgi:hypothetical protein